MRHRKSGIKLGRTTSHRQAMFRNMVTSLFKYDRLQTTDIKAKELRRWADHVITLAKQGDLHARRQVLAILREKNVVHKLFDEVDKRFGKLNGGYTRIVKIGTRPGDAAPISLIELVSFEEKAKKTKKKPKAAAKVKGRQEAPAMVAKEDTSEAQLSEKTPTEESPSEPVEAAAEPADAEGQPESDKPAAVEAATEDLQNEDQMAEDEAQTKTEDEASKKQEE